MIALLVLLTAADLQIAAASDLAGVRVALSTAFEKETGKKVRVTLGSSGLLSKQIENGAPFDVFLSANERYVTDLVKSGQVVKGSVKAYATGTLGLWSWSGKIRKLEDLGQAMHIAIANPQHAPYGAAAKEALEKQELWASLQKKIVYAENVRQALQYAESGNADAVLTAWPLLLDKPGAVQLPAAWHQQIRQSGGVVAASKQTALASRFLQFLVDGAGAGILRGGGFGKP
jgi:molybdate transport system substrate-binding protein